MIQGGKPSIFIAIVAMSFTVGCSRSDGRLRNNAPTGPTDVGVLIENASQADIDALLKQFPEARLRMLYAEHGMIELFGPGLAEVRQFKPNLPVSQNRFLPRVKPLAQPAPEGLEVPGFDRCKGAEKYPEAQLQVESKSGTQGSTFDLSESLTFRGVSESAVRSAFVIIPPSTSMLGEQNLTGPTVGFKPDALGAYAVYLAVQDKDGACALDGKHILVTANPAPLKEPPGALTINLEIFTHLRALAAEFAWQITKGEGVRVAVIDTGVNYNHLGLIGQLDVEAGYDFVNSDPLAYDDDGHGTHVSGLIVGDRFGIAHGAKVIPIKAMTSIGGDIGSIAAGIRRSVDQSARIINMSLGTPNPEYAPALETAIKYAEEKGVVVIAAAGNGDIFFGMGYNIDEFPVYPASIQRENVVTVGALDEKGQLTAYSNFGSKSVSVAAPGGADNQDLISFAHQNPRGAQFAKMHGTSMAAPLVAGTAALLLAKHPSLTPREVKRVLMNAGQERADLTGKIGSGRILTSLSALDSLLGSERDIVSF